MSVEPFIGEVQMQPYEYAPRNWGVCQGATLSINQFQALFALIGNYFGGDGTVTFMLPNFSSRAPMHSGQGPGLSNRIIGTELGTSSVTLETKNLPHHTHSWSAVAATPNEVTTATGSGVTVTRSLDSAGQSPRNYFRWQDEVLNATMGDGSVSRSYPGAAQGHENRQPFLGVRFNIALFGFFPPRN